MYSWVHLHIAFPCISKIHADTLVITKGASRCHRQKTFMAERLKKEHLISEEPLQWNKRSLDCRKERNGSSRNCCVNGSLGNQNLCYEEPFVTSFFKGTVHLQIKTNPELFQICIDILVLIKTEKDSWKNA